MTEFWHRFEDVKTAPPLNEYDEPMGRGAVNVRYCRFEVLRRTPAGVVLDVHGEERFVRRHARKRFACPTIAEALASFKARKRRQRQIYEARARDAAEAVAQVDAMFGECGEKLAVDLEGEGVLCSGRRR